MDTLLKHICQYRTNKVDVNHIDLDMYVSTENMLPNKQGICISKSYPESGYVNEYKQGDILISNIRPYFKKIYLAKNDGGCSADVLVITPQKGINNVFLYYLLSQDSFFDYVMSGSKGCKMPRGDKKYIMEWSIPVFDSINQQQIAGILSSLDAKIETNNKLNEKLEEMAQAIFKSWLDGCDETVQIDDLSLNITDYSKLNKDKVILINSSDVTNGFFDHHNYSDNNKLKGHFKKRFSKGDILYSQVRPRNRHWAYCYFDAEDYIASTQLMVIRNNPEKISSLLLYQYLISDRVWNEFTLKTETRSGTFPQGNYEDLSKICVPYKKDNEKISKTLEHIYNIIYNRYDENQRLASLRDTLLPRLMSGELKV